MIKDGSIGKLTIIELNKFLQANKLPQQDNKPDEIKTIVNHLQVTEFSIPLEEDTDEDEEVILAATVTDNEEAEAEANSRSKSGRLHTHLTVTLYFIENVLSYHLILQKDLTHLEEWADRWDMKFNPKKCYVISAPSPNFSM